MATSTPWGASQYSTNHARGIVSYGTASHGGIHLTASRVQQMPAGLRQHVKTTSRGNAWFEQDAEWSFVHLAFPDVFPDTQKEAEATLRNYFPAVWEAHYGRTLLPEESVVRAEEVWKQANKDKPIVFGAYGHWSRGVIKGKVGVRAAIVGDWNGPSSGHWLVDKDRYTASIDRHKLYAIDPQLDIRTNETWMPLDLGQRQAYLDSLHAELTAEPTTEAGLLEKEFNFWPAGTAVSEILVWIKEHRTKSLS